MSEEVQKTEEEVISEVLTAAKDLLETDKDLVGGTIVCTPIGDEKRWTYVTKYFTLDAIDSESYLLSFKIDNYRLDKVASITHLLTIMLYDELRIGVDHFVDINTNTAFYGDDAYKKYEHHVMTKQGLVECPICDEVVKKDKKFDERGHCRICHKEVLPYATYH